MVAMVSAQQLQLDACSGLQADDGCAFAGVFSDVLRGICKYIGPQNHTALFCLGGGAFAEAALDPHCTRGLLHSSTGACCSSLCGTCVQKQTGTSSSVLDMCMVETILREAASCSSVEPPCVVTALVSSRTGLLTSPKSGSQIPDNSEQPAAHDDSGSTDSTAGFIAIAVGGAGSCCFCCCCFCMLAQCVHSIADVEKAKCRDDVEPSKAPSIRHMASATTGHVMHAVFDDDADFLRLTTAADVPVPILDVFAPSDADSWVSADATVITIQPERLADVASACSVVSDNQGSAKRQRRRHAAQSEPDAGRNSLCTGRRSRASDGALDKSLDASRLAVGGGICRVGGHPNGRHGRSAADPIEVPCVVDVDLLALAIGGGGCAQVENIPASTQKANDVDGMEASTSACTANSHQSGSIRTTRPLPVVPPRHFVLDGKDQCLKVPIIGCSPPRSIKWDCMEADLNTVLDGDEGGAQRDAVVARRPQSGSAARTPIARRCRTVHSGTECCAMAG